MARIVVVGKGSENRDGRGISESQVNDMIQCLAQNVAGGTVADELGGASWLGGWPGWWCCNAFIIGFNNRKRIGLLIGVGWLLEWHLQLVWSKVMDIVVGDIGCCGRDK